MSPLVHIVLELLSIVLTAVSAYFYVQRRVWWALTFFLLGSVVLVVTSLLLGSGSFGVTRYWLPSP